MKKTIKDYNFFFIDRNFNNEKIFSETDYKDRFRNEEEERKAGREKYGMRCTHHVQPLPNTTPFSQNQSDFPDHRILQWYNGLEKTFIVDFTRLQMHVGTRKDPLHCAILRREASIPAWNRQEFHFSCILPITFHLCLKIPLYLYTFSTTDTQ